MIENITVLVDQKMSLSKERTFVLICKCQEEPSHAKIKGSIQGRETESTRHKSRHELGLLEEQKECRVLEHSGVRARGHIREGIVG